MKRPASLVGGRSYRRSPDSRRGDARRTRALASRSHQSAIASPSTRLMLELKKYLSSKIPCGVCVYLFVVTRLTVDSCMPMSSATSRRFKGLRCAMPLSKNWR